MNEMECQGLANAWNSAYQSFQVGARDQAQRYLSTAQRATDQTNTLLQATHRINARAVITAEIAGKSSTELSAEAPSSQWSATHNDGDPFVPLPPPEANLPLRLFAEEVSLTASYNHTLSLLHQGKTTTTIHPTLQPLRTTLFRVQPTINLVIQSFQNDCGRYLSPIQHTSAKDCKVDNKTGFCDDIWESTIQAAQSLITKMQTSTINKESLRQGIYRWANTAASVFDLLSAIELLSSHSSASKTAPTAAYIMRNVAHAALTLKAPSTTSEDMEDVTSPPPISTMASRTTWLQALSQSRRGDDTGALATILPAAEAVLAETATDSSQDGMQDEEAVMYLAAALLLQRGGDAMTAASRFSSESASRTYRTADSLSLTARAAKGRAAISQWRLVLGVDAQRPAAMWLAAGAFSRQGLHHQQAEMLKLLEDYLFSMSKAEVPSPSTPCENNHVVHLAKQDNGVDLNIVRAERGGALCAAGFLHEGRTVLGQTLHGDGVRMALAWAMDNKEFSRSTDVLQKLSGSTRSLTRWQRIGMHLAKAEAQMRDENADGAGKELEEALCEVGSYDGHDHASERVLRGVCYHNVAVVKICRGEAAVVDEWFAGAQTAFEKCEDEDALADVADDLAELTTLARCVAMWACGRRDDAAGHWVLKRGLQGLGEVSVPKSRHSGDEYGGLVTKVEDVTLKRMDAICLRVCQDVRIRDQGRPGRGGPSEDAAGEENGRNVRPGNDSA